MGLGSFRLVDCVTCQVSRNYLSVAQEVLPEQRLRFHPDLEVVVMVVRQNHERLRTMRTAILGLAHFSPLCVGHAETYTHTGSSTFGSRGVSCTRMGNSTFCN